VTAIRKKLTYANVVSTIALFLVLCGGAAIAARVVRRSVGTPQLKQNAVTTAKIKANAVTTRKLKLGSVTNAKLRDGAVSTEKIVNGSVTGEKIAADTTPFAQVVHEARGSTTISLTEEAQLYPLGEATFTQGAHQSDSFLGALDVTFRSSCDPPRSVSANLLLDSPQPLTFSEADVVASGDAQDSHSGALSTRVELGPFFEEGIASATRFEPGAPKSQKLSLVVSGSCSGASSGISATFGGANVVGVE
jgi:hypothetical protein